MKILYIGYLLREEEYKNNPAAMISAGIFEENLLYALKSIIDTDLEVYTVTPNKYYPEGPFYIQKDISFSKRKIRFIRIPYFNVIFVRQLSLFISLTYKIFCWCIKFFKEKKLIIYYNLGTPINESVFFFKYFIKGIYPIVCDYNYHFPSNNYLLSMLHKIIERKQNYYIRKADGVIILNINIANDFHPKRYLVMEGAVSDLFLSNNIDFSCYVTNHNTKKKYTICYCGTIDKSHGALSILSLAKAVRREDNIEFVLAGKISDTPEIISASNDPNIPLKYLGILNQKQALDICLRACLLIIPHDCSCYPLKYQFSSKLFDYISCMIPVLVSPMPGFPEQYKEFVFVAEKDNTESYLKKIEEIRTLPLNQLNNRLIKGKNFVVQHRTWIAQGKRIIDFIDYHLEK